MSTSNPEILPSIFFGSISLMPFVILVREDGSFGQQYLQIEYDINGTEVSRAVLEPVCWMRYE